MPKLQQIKRSNGSLVHSVNIPIEMVSESGWEKGDSLVIEGEMVEENVFKISVFREDDLEKVKRRYSE